MPAFTTFIAIAIEPVFCQKLQIDHINAIRTVKISLNKLPPELGVLRTITFVDFIFTPLLFKVKLVSFLLTTCNKVVA